MVILQKWSLMQGEWSCYRGGNKWENGYDTEVVTNGGRTEVVSLAEGEWLCYRGDHFNGGKMVKLQRLPVYWKENGHVTEVVSLTDWKW